MGKWYQTIRLFHIGASVQSLAPFLEKGSFGFVCNIPVTAVYYFFE